MAAAVDDFASNPQRGSVVAPLDHLAIVTPSDSVDLSHVSRALYLSAVGAVKLTTVGGETVTIASGVLAAGVLHPIRATRIFATGTDAITIIAGW